MKLDTELIHDTFLTAQPILREIVAKAGQTLAHDFPATAEKISNLALRDLPGAGVHAIESVILAVGKPVRLSSVLGSLLVLQGIEQLDRRDCACIASAYLGALEYFFGEEWTEIHARNWAAAFDVISHAFLATTNRRGNLQSTQRQDLRFEKTSDLTGPIRHRRKFLTSHSNQGPRHGKFGRPGFNLPDAVVSDIEETASAAVRAAVGKALHDALNSEIQRYLQAGPEMIAATGNLVGLAPVLTRTLGNVESERRGSVQRQDEKTPSAPETSETREAATGVRSRATARWNGSKNQLA